MRTNTGWMGSLIVAALATAPGAWAQEPEGAEPGAVDLDEEEEFTQRTDAEDELVETDADNAPPPEEELDLDALQITLGVRYRLIVVPQFLINAFGVEGGTTPVAHGVGPEIGFAKQNFEGILSLWYAAYPMSDTPFKAPGDGPNAWEMWNSSVGSIYITGDLLWKTEISKGWEWTIGASGGLGILVGSLERRETYWTNGFSDLNPGNPYTDLGKCQDANTPSPAECAGDFSNEPPWPVYPWLSFQTGIRYQPVRNFVARLDLGAGSSGFWLGLGADYGL